MAIVFSTSDVHPRDAAAYWGEVVTRNFYNYMRPHRDDELFRAELQSGEVGFLGVTSYASSPYVSGRTLQEIGRTDSDAFYVCLQLSGRSIHIDSEGESRLHPGQFFVMDASRPFVGGIKEASGLVSIRVPREKLEAKLGNIDRLTSRPFDGQGTISALMIGFLSMLPERIDALNGVAASKIADQALDLMILALTSEMKSANIELTSPRETALTMLKLAIDTHLRDPSFKPSAAAAAAGISVRYANALLAEEDTSLEGYIIGRRLDHCRRALEDSTQSHRSISEIAFSWGFGDVSHFNRRFKAAYGCAPGEYRKTPRLTAPATAGA